MLQRYPNRRASSLTCTIDGFDHLVSDDAAVVGITIGRGIHPALCGHQIYVAALVSPPGPICPSCVQFTKDCEARGAAAARNQRHGLRARLRGLLRHHRPPMPPVAG